MKAKRPDQSDSVIVHIINDAIHEAIRLDLASGAPQCEVTHPTAGRCICGPTSHPAEAEGKTVHYAANRTTWWVDQWGNANAVQLTLETPTERARPLFASETKPRTITREEFLRDPGAAMAAGDVDVLGKDGSVSLRITRPNGPPDELRAAVRELIDSLPRCEANGCERLASSLRLVHDDVATYCAAHDMTAEYARGESRPIVDVHALRRVLAMLEAKR